MVELRREEHANGPVVTAIGPEGFVVDGARWTGGVILTPLAAHAWAVTTADALTLDSLAPALALEPVPEFLLLGTGEKLQRPDPALIRLLEQRGLGVEVMDSRAAARAWRVLRGEDRWISAALMPVV